MSLSIRSVHSLFEELRSSNISSSSRKPTGTVPCGTTPICFQRESMVMLSTSCPSTRIRPLFRVVESEKQTENNRLSSTGFTDQGSCDAGLAVKCKTFERRLPGVVGEFNIVKFDALQTPNGRAFGWFKTVGFPLNNSSAKSTILPDKSDKRFSIRSRSVQLLRAHSVSECGPLGAPERPSER